MGAIAAMRRQIPVAALSAAAGKPTGVVTSSSTDDVGTSSSQTGDSSAAKDPAWVKAFGAGEMWKQLQLANQTPADAPDATDEVIRNARNAMAAQAQLLGKKQTFVSGPQTTVTPGTTKKLVGY